MQKLEYTRWTTNLKGQYIDGHEYDDVITYWQFIFLPAWSEITQDWTSKPQPPPPPPHRQTMVVWFHDKSTFYANDQHVKRWVHIGETAKPYVKGEGPSQMVANMVSADYGWLHSPDGSEQVVMCMARL